jgi:Parvulin-like peptidyl-prolyl isomerase
MVKQVNAAHILVKSEKEAAEIKNKIAGGEKFADMAKKYSSCPSGKKGGDLGWFGKGQMVAPFEKAAFEASKGNIVGPVKTDFGWHLILVKDQK